MTDASCFPRAAQAGICFRRRRWRANWRAAAASIVVMTDARGTQYPTYFPGAAIEIVPAAAFSDRSKLRLMTAPFEIMAGIVVALGKLLRDQACGGGRLRRLSEPAGDAGGACLARFPPSSSRPNAVVGRANRLVDELCARDRGGLAAHALPAEGHVEGRLHRQSACGPKSWRSRARLTTRRSRTVRCACSCSAAARARAP